MPDPTTNIPDDPSTIWNKVLELAKQNTYCFVETYTCVKCGNFQFNAHTGLEVVQCSDCGTRQASNVPRKPQPNELTIHTVGNVAGFLLKSAMAAQEELPPIQTKELLKLSAENRMLLSRYKEQTIRQTIEKLLAISGEMTNEQ